MEYTRFVRSGSYIHRGYDGGINTIYDILTREHGELFMAAKTAVKQRVLSVLIREVLEEITASPAVSTSAKTSGVTGMVREVLEEIIAPVLSPSTEAPGGKRAAYRKTVIVSPEDRDTGRLIDALAARAIKENKTLQGIIGRLKEHFQDSVVKEAIDRLYDEATPEPPGAAVPPAGAAEAMPPESFDAPLEAVSVVPLEPADDETAMPPEPIDVLPQPTRETIPARETARPEVLPGLFVYGIIGAHEEDVDRALAQLNVRIRVVSYGPVAALVSRVQPTKEVQKAVLEQVIAAGHTVLPVREGGMAMRNERHVVDMLTTHAALLQRAFDYLHHEAEWIVRIACDMDTLRREVDESDHRFESMIDSMILTLRGRTASIARFHANTWAEAAIEVADSPATDLVDNILYNCRKYSHQTLSAAADDSVVNRSERAGAIILEAAYLVARDREEAFRHVLQDLESKYGALGFSYQTDGPQIPNLFAFRNRPRF